MACSVPDCATELESSPEGSNGVLRLTCPGCGGKFLASSTRHRANGRPDGSELAPLGLSTVGPLALRWRAMVLRILEHVYWSVTAAGSLLMLALGGFVPVLRGWLCNEVDGWADVVGPSAGSGSASRRATLIPTSGRCWRGWTPRSCSPRSITVARRLGVKPPGQVRLTYLPCCGVVAWGRSQALLVGLPLLARAHPGRAPRGPGPRAGPPGPRRRHGRGTLGPIRRGT